MTRSSMAGPDELNIIRMLGSWRDRAPEQLAVRAYDVKASKSADEPRLRGSLTVGELCEQTLALAAALRGLGVRPGDVLALQVPNWPQSCVTYFAAAAVGAVVMPISTIYRGRDLSRQVGLSDASIVFVPGVLGNRKYGEDAAGLIGNEDTPNLQHVVTLGRDGAVDRGLVWEDLLEQGRAEHLADERAMLASGECVPSPDDLSLLNFTSGTTGEPKGVKHSARTVFASSRALIDRLGLTSADRLFVPATLGHAAGFLNGMFVPLALEATTVFMDAWDATVALSVIERERVTYGPAMPTYLLDLSEHPRLAEYDISSWSRVRVSGGAIPRSVIADLQERLPTVRLCPGWGMSEVFYATGGAPSDPREKLATCDGRPLDSVDLEIRKPNGERCATDETGEIVVRGPSVMLGYYERENLSRDAHTPDGWFKSGDLGRLDSDGFLTIDGRSKELVIRGGENVPVVEVEHLLNAHPAVEQTAVIGLPDRRLGEKVCAVVQLKDPSVPVTLDQLREFLVDLGLTRQFIPEHLELVGELPRTSLGKLRKVELKKQILAIRNTQLIETAAHS